jgi:pimeloyl-ACP methyl ester carboxylesterase
MKILVNGVHLYFDVEGAGLRAQGRQLEQVPTVLLLHGGPGADHALHKPAFSALADVAQVVYLDHRGNGRSDPASEAGWNMAQWADDVHAFCQALQIDRPIVCGTSFGGMVAMEYATRHPAHPGALVLLSTSAQPAAYAEAKVAMFTRLGGAAVGELARRRFIDGDTSPELLRVWLETVLPLYTTTPQDPDAMRRILFKDDVTVWFNRPGGEGREFDILSRLHRITCPTLVMGGALDPMLPIEHQRAIAAAIRPDVLQYQEFAHCGHGVVPDAPQEAMHLLRRFIQASAAPRHAGTAA